MPKVAGLVEAARGAFNEKSLRAARRGAAALREGRSRAGRRRSRDDARRQEARLSAPRRRGAGVGRGRVGEPRRRREGARRDDQGCRLRHPRRRRDRRGQARPDVPEPARQDGQGRELRRAQGRRGGPRADHALGRQRRASASAASRRCGSEKGRPRRDAVQDLGTPRAQEAVLAGRRLPVDRVARSPRTRCSIRLPSMACATPRSPAAPRRAAHSPAPPTTRRSRSAGS